jgi:hypothetical protein
MLKIASLPGDSEVFAYAQDNVSSIEVRTFVGNPATMKPSAREENSKKGEELLLFIGDHLFRRDGDYGALNFPWSTRRKGGLLPIQIPL